MDNPEDPREIATRAIDGTFDYLGMIYEAIAAIIRALPVLIVGPFVIGAIAYAVVLQVPKVYSSAALVGPLEDNIALAAEVLISSDVVLDNVLKEFGDYRFDGSSADQRRRYLASRIRWMPAKAKSRFYAIEVRDEDPQRARALLSSLLVTWLAATKPKGQDQDRLEALLKATMNASVDLAEAVAIVLKNPSLMSGDTKNGNLPPSIADMIKLRTETTERAENLRRELRGLPNEVLFSPPTLPSHHIWPVQRSIVFASAAWGLVALAVIVLLISVFRFASKTPPTANEIDRFRKSIGYRRS